MKHYCCNCRFSCYGFAGQLICGHKRNRRQDLVKGSWEPISTCEDLRRLTGACGLHGSWFEKSRADLIGWSLTVVLVIAVGLLTWASLCR